MRAFFTGLGRDLLYALYYLVCAFVLLLCIIAVLMIRNPPDQLPGWRDLNRSATPYVSPLRPKTQWVHAYQRADGKWVDGYWRRPAEH